MKKALYRNDDGTTKELYVIKENASGTVDLGTEDGVLVVGSCPIGAKAGHCTAEGLTPKEAAAAKVGAAEAAKEAKAEAAQDAKDAAAAERKHYR